MRRIIQLACPPSIDGPTFQITLPGVAATVAVIRSRQLWQTQLSCLLRSFFDDPARCQEAARGAPIPITRTSPKEGRAVGAEKPVFCATNVAVIWACTQSAAGIPVSASSPEGTSTARIRGPVSPDPFKEFINRMAVAYGSRGSPVNPVPSRASTIHRLPPSGISPRPSPLAGRRPSGGSATAKRPRH